MRTSTMIPSGVGNKIENLDEEQFCWTIDFGAAIWVASFLAALSVVGMAANYYFVASFAVFWAFLYIS